MNIRVEAEEEDMLLSSLDMELKMELIIGFAKTHGAQLGEKADSLESKKEIVI